jgi:hypothetical protein
MQEDRFKQLMLSLPRELIHRIRDTADGRPEDRYDRVVSHIKSLFIPVCGGENCRYAVVLHRGMCFGSTYLHRQTRATCRVDGCGIALSVHGHSVCYEHANIHTPYEYIYFHSYCIPEWDRRKIVLSFLSHP